MEELEEFLSKETTTQIEEYDPFEFLRKKGIRIEESKVHGSLKGQAVISGELSKHEVNIESVLLECFNSISYNYEDQHFHSNFIVSKPDFTINYSYKNGLKTFKAVLNYWIR